MLRAWEFNHRLFKIHGHDDDYFHGLDKFTDYNYGRFIERYTADHGETVLDVGANIGITSIIANSIRPNSPVVAFEPGEKNYRLLLKIFQETILKIFGGFGAQLAIEISIILVLQRTQHGDVLI